MKLRKKEHNDRLVFECLDKLGESWWTCPTRRCMSLYCPPPRGWEFQKIIDPPTDGNFGKISPPLGVGITEKYPPSPGGCGFRKTMSGPFFGRRSASVPAGAVVSSLVYCLFSDGQRNCFKSQQFSDVGHFRTDGATNLPPTYSYGHNCRGAVFRFASEIPPSEIRTCLLVKLPAKIRSRSGKVISIHPLVHIKNFL